MKKPKDNLKSTTVTSENLKKEVKLGREKSRFAKGSYKSARTFTTNNGVLNMEIKKVKKLALEFRKASVDWRKGLICWTQVEEAEAKWDKARKQYLKERRN